MPVSPHSSTVDTGSVSESQQLAWDALDQQLDGNAQVPGSTSRPALTENVVPLPSAIGRSTSSLVLAYLDQSQGGLPGTQSPDYPQPGSPATFDLPNLSESQYTSELNIFTDLPPKLGTIQQQLKDRTCWHSQSDDHARTFATLIQAGKTSAAIATLGGQVSRRTQPCRDRQNPAPGGLCRVHPRPVPQVVIPGSD